MRPRIGFWIAANLILASGPALSQAPTRAVAELGQPPVFIPGKTQQLPLPWPQPNAASVISVNPLNRYQVSLLYRNQYVAQSAVTNGWVGSISPCNAGSTAQALQDATINRVNLYRALAGLPGNISEFGGTDQAEDQQAALMFVANGQLSHSPPNTWTCYTAAGATGAGNSNIALGFGAGFNFNGPAAIDGYMDDNGNVSVGHRRWILYPPQTQMADGDVDSTASSNNNSSDALWVLGPWGTRPSTPNGEPWPPSGYVPWQLLPANSTYWSLSLQNANFSSASVSMTRNGVPLTVAVQTLVSNGQPSGSFDGDNTIVWIPTGATYTQPTQDVVYAITVSGITGNSGATGVPSSVSYTVKVIDPYDAIFANGFEP
jgi:hypothetical protein